MRKTITEGNNGNQPRDRALVIAANGAQQDLNIMTNSFSLNDHFAIMLFDSDADLSFTSTEFLPLINAKPSAINPGHESKIANGLKIETNKIVRGCGLELELIMKHLVKIYSKARNFELKRRHLKNLSLTTYTSYPARRYGVSMPAVHQMPRRLKSLYASALPEYEEPVSSKISMSRFSDDALPKSKNDMHLRDKSIGFTPSREVEFRIDLIPRAIPVAKSPYRSALTELQELSNQIKELKEKDFIRPSSLSWGVSVLFVKTKDVDKFFLPIDFVILDMPEDSRIPIILGRPFLATARAMIDVFNKKIMLRVGNDQVVFDMDYSMKTPSSEDDDLIMEYLVEVSKRRAFWSLNKDILKIIDSDNQYTVSIKEDTVYPCLHSPKTTKETRSIRRI
ncbi:hypothetical protein Tco_0620912 [Tanacetum coccineum]